jgi:metallophosphoesterase (TIGR00282 family)
MVGDVMGKPGRQAVKQLVPELRRRLGISLVVANGENAAGGHGLTLATADELFDAGIHVITSGNHIWSQREFIPHLDALPHVLRPANYPDGTPGHGWVTVSVPDPDGEGTVPVTILNLCGRVHLLTLDCPFRAADRILEQLAPEARRIVLVDFHAEVTSEKSAMGWYLDGRVTVVAGTHTHVPTADTRLLPHGTAYVTDIGMVGPRDSIIGVMVRPVLEHFLSQRPVRFEVARAGPVTFNAVLIDVDTVSGRALAVQRVDDVVEVNHTPGL